MKNKKTLWIVLAVVLAVVLLVTGWGISTKNNLVEKRETVTGAKANVEVMLQRRADLIPNLVNTVKGYAAHEEKVFTDLANARAALSGAKTVEDLNTANNALDSAISRLLVVVENYPDLKADQQFRALMDEISGSENRIKRARDEYNEAAKSYNTKIQKFPTSMIASMAHFEKEAYFEASPEAQTVPEVAF